MRDKILRLGGTTVAILLFFPLVLAQEHSHEDTSNPAATTPQHRQHESEHAMTMMDGPLGLPESRMASGTAWQPDSTPVHAIHFSRGDWSIMAHWNLFAGYDRQGSDRGDSQWIAPNWGMLMETRAFGKGQIVVREMLSLDPVTVSTKGYPLLLQTGESFQGEALHDRQHPHDVFMEIAALYTRPLSESSALQIYIAPSGEPALGPVAFPHRASAASDPLAVLSHHWQDSTHISFGVLTAGLMTKVFKVEGSWFNGREPDEHRYGFDFRRLDSYSGRVSFNPFEAWSFQVSYGFLASPEALRPDESVHRLTASGTYAAKLASGVLAATAVVGRNDPSGQRDTSPALGAIAAGAVLNYAFASRTRFIGVSAARRNCE